ncbi:hypothetical protein ACFU8T_18165 [Sphingobacterium spiritivorum]|uniref:Uncharacterized protein n=1 Tax=Sphingobacterium spiritivorum ATCC 33861 TaxID=525373 RepID=D7VL14_SPHSI|nr:hypothetical protein [Sphingobacterium spiritivorum]EFK58287.1 hypothetical protein HMPREF0766_11683 [Sphingobacterium spiritivorum ATCC 33861]QQT37044.1 hypothetical protein I6J01_06405 [Sphingobacterium spiritivorum]WQD33812.1 hypothetical protein U0038_20110 [Sphingobacterium spiritivorum]SUJ27345.1 Uncharacterised protein [Sphingobacterium spiritivorum]
MKNKALPFYKTTFVILLLVQAFLIFSDNEICFRTGLGILLSYLLIPIWNLLLKRGRKNMQILFKLYIIICGLFFIMSGAYLLATHIMITDYFMLSLAVKGLLMGIGVVIIFKYQELTEMYQAYLGRGIKSIQL